MAGINKLRGFKMTDSVRYKFIKNTTGAAITTATAFPYLNDGDDKTRRVIKRLLTADDIGTGAGQTQHADGVIVDVVPTGYNVLLATVMPLHTAYNAPRTEYDNLTNQLLSINGGASTFITFDIVWWIHSDNTLRVHDKGGAGAKLAANDLLVCELVIGPKENPVDLINFLTA